MTAPPFDPLVHVDNAAAVLIDGRWPNFHDAALDEIRLVAGDIRPDDDVWRGASLEVTLTLWAERAPPRVRMSFRDCSEIRIAVADAQPDIHDLHFAWRPRGMLRDGVTPMTPQIAVRFESHPGYTWCSGEIAFLCFEVEATLLGRLPETR